MGKGKLFVISGTSGVGKSTVMPLVMAAREDLTFSVSATTREPREGEQDGVHYYFITKERFEDMLAQGEFLEYSAHMNNYYGTPKGQLEEKLSRSHVMLDIEPTGAFKVRAVRPDATLIFIAPPSMEVLEQRLRGRGDTPEDQIAIRLERARWELEQSKKYDHIVINDVLETCVDEILNILAQEAD